jgi:hypothetical protein
MVASKSLGLLLFAVTLSAQTTITLTAYTEPSFANPSTLGTQVTLIASVAPTNASGSVVFYDGVIILGIRPVLTGLASLSTRLMASGSHQLKAYYTGDAANRPATSNIVSQSVAALPSTASFAMGYLPDVFDTSVLIADFNNDGKADLAFSIADLGFLVVQLGQGNGRFTNVQIYNSPEPQSDVYIPVATGDFDGDGKTDLVVWGTQTKNIRLFTGKGDGTFQLPVTIATSNNFRGVAGDFNGDGKIDLAIVDLHTGVTVLLGNGNGTFQPPIAYPTSFQSGLGAINIKSGDFNGDGIADFATIDGTSSTVSVLLGKGDGTFQLPSLINLPSPPISLVAADLNQDGRTDLATGHDSNPRVAVLLGRADGTFQTPVIYPAPAAPRALEVGDLLGDGSLDLALNSGNTLSILPGNGDGTFRSPVSQNIPDTFAPPTLIAGEFNGDGKTDLITRQYILLSTTINLTVTGGAVQTANIGTPFPAPLQVLVRNGLNPVSGATVNFFPSFGVTLSSFTAVTDANGVASVNAVAGSSAGSFFVTASFSGVSAQFALIVGGGGNLAVGRFATQSSTLPGYPNAGPASAIDGNTNGNFYSGSVTHTDFETNPWWQVDLGAAANINSVILWNRTDCCADRLSDYWVFISNTPFSATDTPATLQGRAGTFSTHRVGIPSSTAVISIAGLPGRYLRIQLSGANYLSLAEVQIFGTGGTPGPDLALNKPATQSSTLPDYAGTGPQSAIDGNTDGNFFHGSVTHTNADANAWWQVDLGASAAVNSVVIWNRTDACCTSRLSDYWVFVSNTPFLATDTPATLQTRAGTFASHQTAAPNPSTSINTGGFPGRYVRVQLSGTNNLSLAEVQVFGQ